MGSVHANRQITEECQHQWLWVATESAIHILEEGFSEVAITEEDATVEHQHQWFLLEEQEVECQCQWFLLEEHEVDQSMTRIPLVDQLATHMQAVAEVQWFLLEEPLAELHQWSKQSCQCQWPKQLHQQLMQLRLQVLEAAC